MHLIKVNAINSTNSFAREMFRENPAVPATCIVAKKQLQGRGQRGTVWNSEEGKNLTFSVLFPKPGILPGNQFVLSAAVAISILRALEKYDLPRLKVKWPNDIMSANLKIGGILIENVIADSKLAATVIGVGLNVNQEKFEGLPGAGSMHLVSGRNFDLEQVLEDLLDSIENQLNSLDQRSSEAVLREYKDHLFKLQVPSTFQLPDETYFSGMIADVSATGKLLVRTEEDLIKEYDLKEIRLCY
jgi:BirA family biotin operon repressor/biotin-[acetyl-CoA-carboxylase] ligase